MAVPRYLREYLEAAPANSVQQVQGKWLLNLVHMTLGDHPEGVEPEYRLPLEAFGSGADFPRFKNVAPALGIDTFNLSGGAVVDDFDGDTDLDIFTTTFDPSGEPRFFVGDGAGGFEDRTSAAGLKGLYGGLNVVHGDYDNDGDLDLYVLRGAWFGPFGRHANSLLRNESAGPDGRGMPLFRDVTFLSGLGDTHYPTQTAAWADVDNDGDLDLFVANGHVADTIEQADSSQTYYQPNQMFRNDGGVRFADVSSRLGPDFATVNVGRGTAVADYDNDGDLDLLITTVASAPRLLRNDGGNQRHWLLLELVGARHPDALGARVTVTAEGRRQVRERQSGGSYLSSHDPRLHFGLETATRADVDIRWADGARQQLRDVPADQILRVVQPTR